MSERVQEAREAVEREVAHALVSLMPSQNRPRIAASLDALIAAVRAERDEVLLSVMEERESAVRERDEARALHHDLVYQVGKVTPGETRHESARRIIRHHEEHCGQGGPMAALEAPDA